MLKVAVLAATATAFSASDANAAGFEKVNMWGARWSAVQGIAGPTIQGSDSLYYNPAGLAADKEGHSLGVNISPTSATFSGPINNSNEKATSSASLSLPFGLTYSHAMGDWGFGIGAFASGGNSVEYKDVSFGPSFKPAVKTAISLVEISAGAAYKVSPDLKLGLAWRVTMAQADFAFVTRLPTSPLPANSVANTTLKDLKETQAVAFRAGAQYRVDESTDVSLTFRSEVNLKVKGKAQTTTFNASSGTVIGAATTGDNDATASTTFPMMIALAGAHKLNGDWDLMAQYDFAQYSRVGELVVESSTFPGGSTRLTTDWRDQHTIRLGAEYKTPWPVRFGTSVGTAVTNPDYARPTFTGPGLGYSFTVGTGKAFGGETEADSNFRVDGTLEYSSASGDVSGRAASGTVGAGQDTRNGEYTSTGYAAHIGMTYNF